MVIFTGIQPSGIITLGNYIGSIKNFKQNNNKDDTSYFCIVDQHALTMPKPSAERHTSIKTLVALYMAMGLDEETNIFIQSDVPGHSQLAWTLMCFAKNGELERMTQYKDKSNKNIAVSAGLFTYPVLMAADILLYDTQIVPVGADQKQHIELTRDLAERFNNYYDKEVFILPEPIINEQTSKIYSLVDPTVKMSKSDENPKSYISMLDDEKTIMKKVKSATTDSLGIIKYDEKNQPGVANLLTIFSDLKNISIDEALIHFEGCGYGDLKVQTAEVIIKELKPIQERFNIIINNDSLINEALNKGTKTANDKATTKIKEVYNAIGFLETRN
ncbi:MAG: tryptophan--tRNA ligase, partial [Spiroplasma sp.]|nr:tryptophan--tRNA ligase [Mycoplasmatales bacterium]